jgi:hypothetical protein
VWQLFGWQETSVDIHLQVSERAGLAVRPKTCIWELLGWISPGTLTSLIKAFRFFLQSFMKKHHICFLQNIWDSLVILPLQATDLLRCRTLTLWSWALLERPSLVQPLDSFPAFYGTRRFISAFTRALHLSLSWARPTQSTPPHAIPQRSISILSTHQHLGLPSGPFHSGFPTNNL